MFISCSGLLFEPPCIR